MARFGLATTKFYSLLRHSSYANIKRTFLSEAYQCREAWEKRLDGKLLSKVNVQTLYQEIDRNYSDTGRISAIDADIFINATPSTGFVEDVEDILLKFRRTPDTTDILPSSHHAAVRLLLDAGMIKKLLMVLNDRLTYGVFPDSYCCNLLMDLFVKEQNYAKAARIAVLQMLQEDSDNLLTNRLSLYSCHMYVRHSDQTWYYDEEVAPPPPEPKEVVRVRVKFLRKPYFDDHFDLKEPSQLVGKTLCFFSKKVGGSEELTMSYFLLGLTLQRKWNQAIDFACDLLKTKKSIHREVITIAAKLLEAKPEIETPSTETSGKSKPDPNEDAKVAAAKADSELKLKLCEALKNLETVAVEKDLLEEISSLVKEAVMQQETKEIEEQSKLYAKWEEERISRLQQQQEENKRQETLKRIEQEKRELIEREREVYFFDSEDKLDLMIETKKEALKDIVDKQKTSVSKASKDDDYIPPEVFRRNVS